MIEKFYATTSSGQIHGRAGQSTSTSDVTPIVLLHRTPVSSASFTQMMRFLTEQGHTCYAFDTPGFGESFMPSGMPAAADYGRWLLEAIDATGLKRFHLAAHHTGTHFAAEIAALAPDRVASLTLSGVLFAPPEVRAKMHSDIGNAPDVDADGIYMADTFKLMKSLFLDPDAELIHAETMGALVSARGRDLAFNAIFAQDFADVIGRIIKDGRVPVQVVQASDDPLTLTGHLARFREAFPQVPVTITGPAFLATPERQSGAFSRAILAFTKENPTMDNRRYELVNKGDHYALQRADQPVPVPGHGEVLVRVRAVSLNRRDLGVRDLSYPVNGADHFTPLSDAAGDVIAVGEGVTQWQVGDRVMSTFFQNFSGGRLTLPALLSSLGAGGPGVFADNVVLAEGGLLPVPEGWTYEEAACLPCAGVTAWSALKSLGGVQKGDNVLVIGTGGVALFALQIAAASGAHAIILSSSNDKIARAREMGAADAINYRDTPEWADEVRQRTQGAGVQHVVELGGVGTLQKSIASLGLGGHLALIGALDGFGGEMNAMPLIFSALRVSAVMVGSREDHAALSAFMVEHGLKPVIDSRFSFAEAEAAYTHAGTGVFGKVVITLD